MLYSLHIENIAVIKCVDIDFSAGFTALTGETGAGKSILIDSINFLLGARTSKDIIRSGEEKATVYAMFGGFSLSDIEKLAANDISLDEDGNLLISRSMSVDGRTQSKINGRAVNTSSVRAIAPMLVNIHGQNDSLRLLEDENHIVFLDAYAENSAVYAEYLARFEKMKEAQKAYNELKGKNNEKAKREAELKQTIKLLESAKIKVGEEEKLLAEKKIVANAEKISKQTSFVYRALKGSEKANAAYILDRSATALLQIADSVPEAATLAAKLSDMKYEIEDIADTVYDFTGDIGDDPTAKLDKIESRLNTINKLKKHFLTDESGLVDLLDKTKKSLGELEDIDGALSRAKSVCEEAEKAARAAADKLTESRMNSAKKLIPLVSSELEFLDMEKVVFDISVTQNESLSQSGADSVVFLISANRGEVPKPISKLHPAASLQELCLQ